MTPDVTQLLNAIEAGDPHAASQLLPLVYDDLRRLAADRLAHEAPGQTLQPTALVHEAYLRLVEADSASNWDSRRHFFGAAAEAMRRILVEQARRKKALKRGGGNTREPLDPAELLAPEPREDLLALDEALERFAAVNAQAAQLVQLRYFGGMSIAEAAKVLCISSRTANRLWVYARAWLHREIKAAEAELIGKLHSKEPAQRPASAQEVADVLARYVGTKCSDASKPLSPAQTDG